MSKQLEKAGYGEPAMKETGNAPAKHSQSLVKNLLINDEFLSGTKSFRFYRDNVEPWIKP